MSGVHASSARCTILCVFALAVACGPSVDFVRAPSTDWPFFLIVQGNDRDPEVSGPHRWTDQDPTFRFGVRGVDRIELLAVDWEGLVRSLPAAAADAFERVRVEPGAERCEDGRVMEGGLRLPLGAPYAELFRLVGRELEPTSLVEQPMSLWVPTDPEACFDAPAPVLEPFGDRRQLLPPGVFDADGPAAGTGRDLRFARALGPDRLLSATARQLLVFERGRPFVDEPRTRWQLQAMEDLPGSMGRWLLYSLDVATSTAGPEVFEIHFIAAWVSSTEPREASLIGRVLWSEAGFSEPRYTEPIAAELRFVGADSSGRWVVVGHGGTVLVREAGARDFRVVDLSGTAAAGVELRAWAPGLTEAEPDVLLDVGGVLYFGDLRAPQRLRTEASRQGGFNPNLVTIPTEDGGVEALWPTKTPEFAHRLADGRRRDIKGYLPPELADCGEPVDECGRAIFVSGAQTYLAQTAAGTVALCSDFCTALVEYHPHKGCSRPLTEPGGAVETRARGLLGVSNTPYGLVVTGSDGLVLVSRDP